MSDPAAAGPSGSPPPAREPPPDAPGERPLPWLQTLQSLWRELPGLVTDRVELLSLELKRAGRALAQVVALLVMAAILGVTAWLVLWAAVVGLLVTVLHWHWALALLAVMLVNALSAWLALQRIRALLPLVKLPATKRHLTLRPTDEMPPTPTTQAYAEPSAP